MLSICYYLSTRTMKPTSGRPRLKQQANRCLVLLGLCMASLSAPAFTFEALRDFESPPNGPYGGLTKGSDGALYCSTEVGGAFEEGTVIRLKPAGGYEIIHHFTPADGSYPHTLAVGSDQCLYGLTSGGGDLDYGAVFKITTNGQFSVVASFGWTNGYSPLTAPLLAADNNFYGITSRGGDYGKGVLFRLSNGELTAMYSFDGATGEDPQGLCRGADGALYGTTRYGGVNNGGTLFKLTLDGTLTTIFHFGNSTNGLYPTIAPTQAKNGFIYGATRSGGAFGRGTIFRSDSFGNVTTLASLDGTNGMALATALLEASDGNFYATGDSHVQKVTPAGEISIVVDFPRKVGIVLQGDLIEHDDGYIYGTSYFGSAGDRGMIFRFHAGGPIADITAFTSANGTWPSSALLSDNGGNLYGTTGDGGEFGQGTVFKIATNGIFSIVHQFDATNGAWPNHLIQGEQNTFYGTTADGGPTNAGTIFRITSDGDFSMLNWFNRTNGNSPTSLVRKQDGTFYGNTTWGGTNDVGVIFKRDLNGVLTSLHSCESPSGNYPAGISVANNGNVYGVGLNGPFQRGVIWQLDDADNYSLTRAFGNGDPIDSPEVIVHDNLGTIFGADYAANVFALQTNGSLQIIGSVQDRLAGGLVLGADGNFYGTSQYGGTKNRGSVWVINRSGRCTRLVSFDESNGKYPSKLFAVDAMRGGTLYGLCDGGPLGGGRIFALVFDSPEVLAQPLSQDVLPGQTASFDVTVFSTNTVSYQWQCNGLEIPFATNAVYSITNVQQVNAGTYSVVASSAGKSVLSSNATLAILPVIPSLKAQVGSGNIQLSWSAAYTNFQLQSSSTLTAPNWITEGNPVTTNNVNMVVLPTSSSAYFRLHK